MQGNPLLFTTGVTTQETMHGMESWMPSPHLVGKTRSRLLAPESLLLPERRVSGHEFNCDSSHEDGMDGRFGFT